MSHLSRVPGPHCLARNAQKPSASRARKPESCLRLGGLLLEEAGSRSLEKGPAW